MGWWEQKVGSSHQASLLGDPRQWGCRLAAEMVIPNLKEGDAELLDAEGVDDRVHG